MITGNIGGKLLPIDLAAKTQSAVSSAVAWTTPAGSLGSFSAFASVKTAALSATSKNNLPVSYSLVEGSLPKGLSLNATTGVISGTTDYLGQYEFTIRASDAKGATADQRLALAIGPNKTVTMKSQTLIAAATALQAQEQASEEKSIAGGIPNTLNLVSYDDISYQLPANSTASRVTFSSSDLPDGLQMSSSGLITGAPMVEAQQTYYVSINVSDSGGKSGSKLVAFNIIGSASAGWNAAGVTVTSSHTT